MTGTVLLAVNGGLMRGFPANVRMDEAGATFVREDRTADCYRMWSIDGRFPGMMRDPDGAVLSLEVWSMTPPGFVAVVDAEPTGLVVGKVELADGTLILGVLAEPWLCEGREEITAYGGWRAWSEAQGRGQVAP